MAKHLKNNSPEKNGKAAELSRKILKKSGDREEKTKTPDRRLLADAILTVLCILCLIVLKTLEPIGLVYWASYGILSILCGYPVAVTLFSREAGLRARLTAAALLLAAVCAAGAQQMAAVLLIAIAYRICTLVLIWVERKIDGKLAEIYEILPVTATLAGEGSFRRAAVKTVDIDDIIFVDKNEVVPLDGEVCDGESTVDISNFTGKSTRIQVTGGSMVYAGSINLAEPLYIRVTETYRHVFARGMLESIRDTVSGRSRLQIMAEKYSYIYMAVLAAAAVIEGIVLTVGGNSQRGLSCAAILLTVAATVFELKTIECAFKMGAAFSSSYGVLFKKSFLLDALSRAKTFVMNKTGIVTDGEYRIEEIRPSKGISEFDLLTIAATAEKNSNHPIAAAIKKAAEVLKVPDSRVMEIRESSGRGISALMGTHSVLVGNAELLTEHHIYFPAANISGTVIHVCVDNNYCGCMVLKEKLKPGAFEALDDMKLQGVKSLVLLTGDSRSAARQIASSLNFDLVKAEMTNEEKLSSLEYLKTGKETGTNIAFIGDGETDAPLLNAADIGIAINTLGDTESVEEADICLLGNDLTEVSGAVRLAVRASRISMQNFIAVIGIRTVIILFTIMNLMSLPLAVCLECASVVLAFVNTTFVPDYPAKLFHKKEKNI